MTRYRPARTRVWSALTELAHEPDDFAGVPQRLHPPRRATQARLDWIDLMISACGVRARGQS